MIRDARKWAARKTQRSYRPYRRETKPVVYDTETISTADTFFGGDFLLTLPAGKAKALKAAKKPAPVLEEEAKKVAKELVKKLDMPEFVPPPPPKPRKKIHSPGYTAELFNPANFPWLVDCAAKAVQEFERVILGYKVDALAFSGNSGMLVPAVAYVLKKGFFAVRQPNDCSHDCRLANGDCSAKTYLIVDDFIDMGTTAERIITQIDKLSHNEWDWNPGYAGPYPRPVGVLETVGGHVTNLGTSTYEFAPHPYYIKAKGGFGEKLVDERVKLPVARLSDLVPEYAATAQRNLEAA